MSDSIDFTENDIALVRRSFSRILKDRDGFAVRLYDRLFEVAPEVRPLFVSSLDKQREKFLATLTLVVSGDLRLLEMDENLAGLGRRHQQYGVEVAHYELFGDVLMWTLRETLGDDLDSETEAAWGHFYEAFAIKMQGSRNRP